MPLRRRVFPGTLFLPTPGRAPRSIERAAEVREAFVSRGGTMTASIWIAGGGLIVALAILAFGWSRVKDAGASRLAEASREASRMLEDSKRDAESRLKEAELTAKEKLLQARSEFETVSRQRRSE